MNQGELQRKVAEMEKIITSYLPKEEGFQKTLAEAINYSFLAGGKRLRPLLMQESFRMSGGRGKLVEPFMAALEMIHTYSLIHDDLPCMDNDEYRRGRKTTHVVYGEGMAVLAGDALLNLAYETAQKAFEMINGEDPAEYRAVAGALKVLGNKAGIYGMAGGQATDVEAEKKQLPVSAEMLLFIHKEKTAALIEAALMIGGILAGASEEQVKMLEQCGENIGIAFQIQDDILDVTGKEEELGKPVGSDAKNHKQTYVTIYGIRQAEADVERLSEEALQIIRKVREEESDSFLEELVLSLIHRTH